MMEGPRHQHLHQEWQEPLEEPADSEAKSRALVHGSTDRREKSCVTGINDKTRKGTSDRFGALLAVAVPSRERGTCMEMPAGDF